eukprot:scaffold137379_cov72-Cyclotella_meneghiniana.AAC.1
MIILTPCYFPVSFLLPPEQITQSKTNLSASSSSASKETPSSPSSSATKGTPKLDESIELDPSTMRIKRLQQHLKEEALQTASDPAPETEAVALKPPKSPRTGEAKISNKEEYKNKKVSEEKDAGKKKQKR